MSDYRNPKGSTRINTDRQHTRDKIKDLIRPGTGPDHPDVLVNAIYFKVQWIHTFEKARPRKMCSSL